MPLSTRSGDRSLASKAEDERQRLVDRADLAGLKPSGGSAETLRIDDRGLLDENASLGSTDRHWRAEARRQRAPRCGSHERSAQVEELAGLDDHRIARAPLLPSARDPGRGEPKHFPADHASV